MSACVSTSLPLPLARASTPTLTSLLFLTPALTPQADPDPAVSALARSLLSRIDPNRLTSPVRPEAGAQEAGGSESEDVEANVPPT